MMMIKCCSKRFARRGLNLQEAILDYWNYIENKRKKMNYFTKTARKIAKRDIVFVKKFSDDYLGAYDEKI
jgi:hypothetical protein